METDKAFSLPYSLVPWDNNTQGIWLASTLTLHRNIAKFHFPNQLGTAQRGQIFTFLKSEILKLNGLRDPIVLRGETLKAVEKEFLLEHYLTVQSFNQAYLGEGFAIDTSGQFLATINLGEHLKLQSTCIDEDLFRSLERLIALESQLSRQVNFAFSSKFGFLNADPMRCGTGLSINCFMHLPALEETGILIDTLAKQRENGVEFFGIGGKPESYVASIVVVRNTCSLGWSEEKITSVLHSAATRLIAAEKRARLELKTRRSEKVVDRICRSFGLLRYSYQLHTSEALEALGLMKLALDMGWLKGIAQASLNQLLFQLRRAHLQFANPHTLADSLTQLRANKLQQAFSRAELVLNSPSEAQ